jgi:asparagine synthase (glutamine-hydrolysing)
LAAYEHWGENCLEKLNGMFAFAIYNIQERSLFIARDRFGIKPFYYYVDKNKFVFASEIASILKVLKKKPQQDDQSIFDYLLFNRTDQTERTFFNGIRKLQHGHELFLKDRHLQIKRWYRLSQNSNKPSLNPGDFRHALSASIGLMLRSDVPVGVCLSGGLDSSSIVSLLLRDHNGSDINTFSSIYGKGITGDESDFIDEYSGVVENMHFTYPSADSLYDDMYDYVKAHNEPTPSTSPYAQFKVME